MDRIYNTQGNSVFVITCGESKLPRKISVLSQRACRFVLKANRDNNWRYRIHEFNDFFVLDGFAIVGYQPELNNLVGYKTKQQ